MTKLTEQAQVGLTTSERLDEFVKRQGIVSAEFCKIIDEVEQREEAYVQLVDKLKLVDTLKQNAELKMDSALLKCREYRKALIEIDFQLMHVEEYKRRSCQMLVRKVLGLKPNEAPNKRSRK